MGYDQATTLGKLAIDMKREQRRVEQWMKDEAISLRLVQAGECPTYHLYVDAATRFFKELEEVDKD